MRNTVQPIACDGHTHVVVLEHRYLRWRCTDRNCPDARKARNDGLRAFHVHDLTTGRQWTEFEPSRERAA